MKKAVLVIALACFAAGGFFLNAGQQNAGGNCGKLEVLPEYLGDNDYQVTITNTTNKEVTFDLYQNLHYWTGGECSYEGIIEGLTIAPMSTEVYAVPKEMVMCLCFPAPPGEAYGDYTVETFVTPGNCVTSETLHWED